MTEVGRQPWIVYNVMRTSDAVTHAERHLGHLRRRARCSTSRSGAALIITLRAMSRRWREADEQDVEVPYGPDAALPAPRREAPR